MKLQKKLQYLNYRCNNKKIHEALCCVLLCAQPPLTLAPLLLVHRTMSFKTPVHGVKRLVSGIQGPVEEQTGHQQFIYFSYKLIQGSLFRLA